MAQLEEETGVATDSRHETFSGTSSIDDEMIDDDVEAMPSYQPVIETKRVKSQKITTQPITPTYAPVPIVPVVNTPSINYNQENGYVRSESIMDSFEQKNSVDLNAINTGIEYNEGTTFTNIQPRRTSVPVKLYAAPTSKKAYSIQLASSSSQNRINRIVGNLPASMQQNIRVIKVGNMYKALALNAPSVSEAKSQLSQYRSYVPDAFIKATYPLSEERL
jgi:hypothetical protein